MNNLFKERFLKIAGDWNGEEETFSSEGTRYSEHQAVLAQDIVDKLDSIEKEKTYWKTIADDITKDMDDLLEMVTRFNQ